MTADMLTEDEAVEIVAKEGELEDVSTLKELIVAYVNELNGTEYDVKNDYDKMIADFSGTYDGDFSTPQSTFSFMMQTIGNSCTTVQELAASLYSIDSATEKTLKINGEQVTEENGVKWEDSYVYYTVDKNQKYEILLELDGKIGVDIIEVTEIKQSGKYVKFDSDKDGSVEDEILYRVLYEDGELGEGHGAQIITADVTEMSEVSLNFNDLEIPENELTEISDSTNLDFEKALWTYNNFVKILNKACTSQVNLREGITTGEVRNVGSNPINPNQDTEDDIEISDINNYSGTWFDNYIGKLRRAGAVNTSDLDKIRTRNLGVQSGEDYWICSRGFMSPSLGSMMDFKIQMISNSSTNNGGIPIGRIMGDGSGVTAETGGMSVTYNYKVRSIVTLEYGVLEKAIERNPELGVTEQSPLILK